MLKGSVSCATCLVRGVWNKRRNPYGTRIILRGVRHHNLKNLSLNIPREKFIVVTGISGSGKSTLAFDVLYAEAHRRFIESLSGYARMFLGIMQKPDVDYIEGIPPAISVEQKTASHNPRSIVGTVTEIYDYLRLLFAHVGVPYCPEHRIPMLPVTVDEIVDRVLTNYAGERIYVLAPVVRGKKVSKETHRTNSQNGLHQSVP